jgi:hypothetical protein
VGATLHVEHPAVQVGAGGGGLHEGHVVLVVEDGAHRVGDVGGVQPGGGDLVEQRLEGVEVVAVDQRDRHVVGLGQGLGGGEPAEAGPDDHHLVLLFTSHGPRVRRRPPAAHGFPDRPPTGPRPVVAA